MNAVAEMTAYYRANIHRFAEDYLGVKLKLFQKILIYMMSLSTNFMFIARRGLGKSFLIAVFACCWCILYPGTAIVVSSKIRKQAIGVLTYVDQIRSKSPNLKMEIKSIVKNQSDAEIEFWNHSKIKVATANENSRFMRRNINIYDEFRMMPLDVINAVLKKFLTVPRQPGFLSKPEYKDYPRERNKEFFLSSAWFASHWSYKRMLAYTTNFLDISKRYFVCGLPYQLSIDAGLLDKDQVRDEMSESDFNEITFDMEMSCIWQGSAVGALFDYDNIERNRKLTRAFYPPSISNLLNDKKLKIPPKNADELRILSVDIALMASVKHDNDASSIWITRSTPNSSGNYITEVVYGENIEGMLTEDLGILIRKYFAYFDCDYIILDANGNGLGVFDALTVDRFDDETGEVLPALNSMNDESMQIRCRSKNAQKLIYTVKATEKFNSESTLLLREGFRQGKIKLLCSEYDAEENELEDLKGYSSLDQISKTKLLLPYLNTTLLINELINLTYEPKGNLVKVHEKSGFRKDRFSSMSYNYWFIIQQELKLNKQRENIESFDFLFKAPNTHGRRK